MPGTRPKTENFERSRLEPWCPRELPVLGMPRFDRPRARSLAQMRARGRPELIHGIRRLHPIPPPPREETRPESPPATANVAEDRIARTAQRLPALVLVATQ